jgi:3-dehydroquinate synthetase
MKKFYIFLTMLLFTAMLISQAFGDEAVDAAKAKFNMARKAYIVAKEKLSDAQIKSLRTIGKAEKAEAVKNVLAAREEVKSTKLVYKAALSELRKAEIARDSKIDRSPWK